MKRLWLITLLLALLLLSSCSRSMKSYLIASDSGSELYMFYEKKAITITFDSAALSSIIEGSGLKREDALSSLAYPKAMVITLDRSESEKRRRSLDLLTKQRDEVDLLLVYKEDYRVLKRSKLLKELDEMTLGLESQLLKNALRSNESGTYDASLIFSSSAPYSDKVEYYRLWIEEIFRQ